MAYDKISGVVTKTRSNTGIMSFEVDGKPVTFTNLVCNQDFDGHTVIVAGKNKENGFTGVGLYDKTSNTTFRSMNIRLKPMLIGGICVIGGLPCLGLFLPLGLIIIAFGGYYFWSQYMVPNKLIDSFKKEN